MCFTQTPADQPSSTPEPLASKNHLKDGGGGGGSNGRLSGHSESSTESSDSESSEGGDWEGMEVEREAV